jgi:hypothetical protein
VYSDTFIDTFLSLQVDKARLDFYSTTRSSAALFGICRANFMFLIVCAALRSFQQMHLSHD